MYHLPTALAPTAVLAIDKTVWAAYVASCGSEAVKAAKQQSNELRSTISAATRTETPIRFSYHNITFLDNKHWYDYDNAITLLLISLCPILIQIVITLYTEYFIPSLVKPANICAAVPVNTSELNTQFASAGGSEDFAPALPDGLAGAFPAGFFPTICYNAL